MTCGTSADRVAIPSRMAPRDEARLTTSVLPGDTDKAARDTRVHGAGAARPEERSASAMPGIGRSSTLEVASGVTSG